MYVYSGIGCQRSGTPTTFAKPHRMKMDSFPSDLLSKRHACLCVYVCFGLEICLVFVLCHDLFYQKYPTRSCLSVCQYSAEDVDAVSSVNACLRILSSPQSDPQEWLFVGAQIIITT
jgi:hypothetical protein